MNGVTNSQWWGIAIPAVAAAVGLIVALALLDRALRLLIRPIVWAAQRVSAATGFGTVQFAFGIGGALGLHRLEQTAGADRLMLAAMHLTPIGDPRRCRTGS